VSMPAKKPDPTPIVFEELDEELILMPVLRTRSQTVLPAEVEQAYNGSTRRRPKASRKDYAAGYNDAWDDALDWVETQLKKRKTS
jgi:hypothetical protein